LAKGALTSNNAVHDKRLGANSMGININMKSTSGKILASVALVGTAAAVAGMGTYGAFTSTTTASEAVTAGTVTIALGDTSNVNTGLSVPVAGILPGDKVEKFVTLSNTGNSALNSVVLTTGATETPASPLAADATYGLQLTIENCSTAWTAVTSGEDTCSGTKTSVLGPTPVTITPGKALNNLTSLTPGKTDNLKVTTSLPTSTPNSFQGASTTIGFTFTGTQRTETVK
jgi:predicted ribosomally synthesized peptide with SipW-like signal peptide